MFDNVEGTTQLKDEIMSYLSVINDVKEDSAEIVEEEYYSSGEEFEILDETDLRCKVIYKHPDFHFFSTWQKILKHWLIMRTKMKMMKLQ